MRNARGHIELLSNVYVVVGQCKQIGIETEIIDVCFITMYLLLSANVNIQLRLR